MCNLGNPLTAGEMLERLSDVPPETLIRFTSWNRQGEVTTYTVHRADYPVKAILDGESCVWLSFDAHEEKNAGRRAYSPRG